MTLGIYALITVVLLVGIDRGFERWGFFGGSLIFFVLGGLASAAVYSVAYSGVHSLFGTMAGLDLLIFVSWPIWILTLVVRGRLSKGWLLAIGVLVAIAVDAHFIEPNWLEESTVELEAAGISKPIRIAIVADLQTDNPGDFERHVLERVMANKPDLILLPGDFVHTVGPRSEHQKTQEALRDLFIEVGVSAPLGAYAVKGNVDSARDWPRIFAGTEITPWTTTSSRSIGELLVWGLTLEDSFDPKLHLRRDHRFTIVFGHGPDFALGDIAADLLVAGHTHGGQVRLPFIGPLMTLSRVSREWAAGETYLPGGRTLLVSRGIGMERGPAPRLRFLCRPELIFVDLVPEKPNVQAKPKASSAALGDSVFAI